MGKNFLTRSTIEDMIAEGRTEYRLQRDDVVTHHARDHARSKSFPLIPADEDSAPSASPPDPSIRAPAAGTDEARALPISREKLRSAVIAALGVVPDGLDEVIDRAMKG